MRSISVNDCPDAIDAWEEILESLGGTPPDADDIITEAIHTQDTNLSNIRITQTLRDICDICEENPRVETAEYYVNNLDSHLYINGEEIISVEDFTKATGGA